MKFEDVILGHLYADETGNIYRADGKRSETEQEFTVMKLNLSTLSFIPSDIEVIFTKFDILSLTEVGESPVLQPELVLSVSDILAEFASAIKQKARPMDDYYSDAKGTYNAIDEDDVDELLKQFKEKYTK